MGNKIIPVRRLSVDDVRPYMRHVWLVMSRSERVQRVFIDQEQANEFIGNNITKEYHIRMMPISYLDKYGHVCYEDPLQDSLPFAEDEAHHIQFSEEDLPY